MSQSQSIYNYDLGLISNSLQLQQLCSKQQKLIQLLHKQLHTLKNVMVSIQNDIQKYQATFKSISTEYQLSFNGINSLQNILPQIKNQINLILKDKLKNIQPVIQFRQVLKEVPVFIEKQIEIIKQVEKPIFVQKIREVQKPVFVQKIIEVPCTKCQIASHKRIKT